MFLGMTQMGCSQSSINLWKRTIHPPLNNTFIDDYFITREKSKA